MRPIIHISFPVRDIKAALDFYTCVLGARIGKSNETSVDVLLFGAQLTLQDDPSSVTDEMPRSRHFGATFEWTEWQELADQLRASEHLVEEPTVSFVGKASEQAKLMIADPSGNLIELKAYRNPESVLGLELID